MAAKSNNAQALREELTNLLADGREQKLITIGRHPKLYWYLEGRGDLDPTNCNDFAHAWYAKKLLQEISLRESNANSLTRRMLLMGSSNPRHNDAREQGSRK